MFDIRILQYREFVSMSLDLVWRESCKWWAVDRDWSESKER